MSGIEPASKLAIYQPLAKIREVGLFLFDSEVILTLISME